MHGKQNIRYKSPQTHRRLAFSTASEQSEDLPPTTLVDPSRPSLFYHLLAAPNPLSDQIPAYAVSFLEHPSKDPRGPAVLGWLPAAASTPEAEEAGLGDFKENANFLNTMHDVVRKVVEEGADERLNAEALQRGEGWMHINDDRNVPALGRIGDPDDIIASVMVEDGKILSHTYNPMPSYRICTADGLTTLPEGLQSRLLEDLRRREEGGNTA